MRVADGTRAAPARDARTERVDPPPGRSRASLPQEHVVARLRQSGRRLVLPAVLFVVLCGAAGYWSRRVTPLWALTAVLVVAALLVLLFCVAPLVRWLNRVVILTDRRVIVTRGFVVRRRQEALLAPGTEAVLRRGPLQLLAGSGTVIVRPAGEGAVVLHDLPSARLVHAAIVELVGRLR